MLSVGRAGWLRVVDGGTAATWPITAPERERLAAPKRFMKVRPVLYEAARSADERAIACIHASGGRAEDSRGQSLEVAGQILGASRFPIWKASQKGNWAGDRSFVRREF